MIRSQLPTPRMPEAWPQAIEAVAAGAPPPRDPSQHDLALLLLFTVAVVAVMTVVVPAGQEVLKQLLPPLMFVLGYIFPRLSQV